MSGQHKTPAEIDPNAGVNPFAWVQTVAQIIGIPALIVVMFMNWGSFRESGSSTEVNVAEAQRIQIDTRLKMIELEEKLSELTSRKIDDFENYKTDVLPVIERTSELLREFSMTNDRLWVLVLLKAIVVGFLFTIMHFSSSVFREFWHTLINLVQMNFGEFISRRHRASWNKILEDQTKEHTLDFDDSQMQLRETARRLKQEQNERYYEKVRFWFYLAVPIVSSIPSIVLLALEFFLIVNFSYGIAQEAAVTIGIGAEFTKAMGYLSNLQFGDAFRELQAALFSYEPVSAKSEDPL